MPMTATVPLEAPQHEHTLVDGYVDTARAVTSAVSWGAIVAGAAAAASLSLILLMLGVGLGLISISPWSSGGISVARLGVSTILWLTLTQLLSSAMAGYLVGRLRTRWTDTPVDEVYFRDTAHGFLAWAVGSLATAALFTSVIGSILSGGVQAGVTGAASTVTGAVGGMVASGQMSSTQGGPMAYFVDALFRQHELAETDSSTTAPISAPANERTVANEHTVANERTVANEALEVERIFMNVNPSAPLPLEDIRYVGQLVAHRTGVSQQEAERRVTDVYERAQAKLENAELSAKDAADKARKVSAYAALWMSVSLLIGAFVASLAATYGGRQRDA